MYVLGFVVILRGMFILFLLYATQSPIQEMSVCINLIHKHIFLNKKDPTEEELRIFGVLIVFRHSQIKMNNSRW